MQPEHKQQHAGLLRTPISASLAGSGYLHLYPLETTGPVHMESSLLSLGGTFYPCSLERHGRLLPRFSGVVACVRHRTRSGLNHFGASSVEPDGEDRPTVLCLPQDSIVGNAVVICRNGLESESDLVVPARREGLRNRPSDRAVLERIKARAPNPLIKRLVIFPPRALAEQTRSLRLADVGDRELSERRHCFCAARFVLPKRCVTRRVTIPATFAPCPFSLSLFFPTL